MWFEHPLKSFNVINKKLLLRDCSLFFFFTSPLLCGAVSFRITVSLRASRRCKKVIQRPTLVIALVDSIRLILLTVIHFVGKELGGNKE